MAASSAGILLTGGASTRMGRDKATIALDGVTLAARAAAVLRAVCDVVVEVGPGVSGLPSIHEVPPGSGPLAAMVAGAHAVRFDAGHEGPVIVLASDMPRVPPDLLVLLRDAPGDGSVVPECDGRLQPLCARWSRVAVERASELLAAGSPSMQALLAAEPFARLSQADWEAVAGAGALDDVDTPEDLERLRGASRE